jgi:hypothetical protein
MNNSKKCAMKRILMILPFVLYCMAFEAKAQFVYAIGDSGRSAVSTQLSDVRYEFVQAPTNSSQAFLVDKYEGNVWKYKGKRKGFEEIARDDRDVVDTTKVNYQLYISATDSSQCFLLNVHTGEMWRYGDGEEGGKTFIKLEMPFLIPKKE